MLGFSDEMLLIVAGGCVVIYGEGHPFRSRWKVMSLAGLCLLAGAVAGSFVGSVVFSEMAAGGSHWWLLLTALLTTCYATAGAFVQNALRLPPPGSFFLVMITGGSTMLARLGFNPVEVGGWALIGVISAMIIGMSPALWNKRAPQEKAVQVLENALDNLEKSDAYAFAVHHQAQTALTDAWFMLADAGAIRGGTIADRAQADLVERVIAANHRIIALRAKLGIHSESNIVDTPNMIDQTRSQIPLSRPSAAYRIFRSFEPYSHASMTAMKVATACMASGVVSLALGLDRPDWAVVSALMVLQWGPDRTAGSIRGIHRFVGSILGILLYAGLHYLELGPLGMLIALALCQFGAEVLVVKNYALTNIVTTPLALLMGGNISGPLAPTVISRISEVTVSIIFSLIVLQLWRASADEKHYLRHINRSFRQMSTLLGGLLTSKPKHVLEQRRDLQYELLSERQAIVSLAVNHPEKAQSYWSAHREIRHAGYLLLDFCRAHADDRISMAQIEQLSAEVLASQKAAQVREAD